MRLKSILDTLPIFKIPVVALCFLYSGVQAQESNSFAQKDDLTLRFISVSPEGNASMVSDYSNFSTLGFFIRKTENFDIMKICNGDFFNVWFNSRLYFTDQTCLELGKDDIFQKVESDSVYIVINTDGDFNELEAETLTNDFDRAIIYYPINSRYSDESRSTLITISLSLILIFGLLKYYLYAFFSDLFKASLFRRISSRERTDEFDQNILIGSLILSLAGSYCYWYVNDLSNPAFNMDYLPSILRWLLYAVIIFLALVFKYFFINLIAKLNSFRNLAYIQIYDFLKFFTLISVIFSSIFVAKFWLDFLNTEADHWLWRNFYLLAYIVFLLYYFYKMSFELKYKKLHIISYLCTTEILGVLIIAIIFTQ